MNTQLLIRTTEHKKECIDAIAKSYNLSTNQLMNFILDAFIAKEKENMEIVLKKAGMI